MQMSVRDSFKTLSIAACRLLAATRGRSRMIVFDMVLAMVVATYGLGSGMASSYSTITISVRGKPQALAVYSPLPGAPKRPFQIIVTSGDLGWIGLSTDVAEYARSLGFRTIGFNARAYLSSFTGRSEHLDERDIPGDFQEIINWARSDRDFPQQVVLIGVSEGAGLNVLGLSQPGLLRGCKGLIALGMPARTSLGWHWTDFPMWITKRDPREPQAVTGNYLTDLRIPLVMIHSSRDEWDSIDQARNLFAEYRGPKRFIAVNAANHRFSDKIPEVMGQLEQSLQWLQSIDPQS